VAFHFGQFHAVKFLVQPDEKKKVYWFFQKISVFLGFENLKFQKLSQ